MHALCAAQGLDAGAALRARPSRDQALEATRLRQRAVRARCLKREAHRSAVERARGLEAVARVYRPRYEGVYALQPHTDLLSVDTARDVLEPISGVLSFPLLATRSCGHIWEELHAYERAAAARPELPLHVRHDGNLGSLEAVGFLPLLKVGDATLGEGDRMPSQLPPTALIEPLAAFRWPLPASTQPLSDTPSATPAPTAAPPPSRPRRSPQAIEHAVAPVLEARLPAFGRCEVYHAFLTRNYVGRVSGPCLEHNRRGGPSSAGVGSYWGRGGLLYATCASFQRLRGTHVSACGTAQRACAPLPRIALLRGPSRQPHPSRMCCQASNATFKMHCDKSALTINVCLHASPDCAGSTVGFFEAQVRCAAIRVPPAWRAALLTSALGSPPRVVGFSLRRSPTASRRPTRRIAHTRTRTGWGTQSCTTGCSGIRRTRLSAARAGRSSCGHAARPTRSGRSWAISCGLCPTLAWPAVCSRPAPSVSLWQTMASAGSRSRCAR